MSERTELNRLKHKGRSDIADAYAILDGERVGSLGWADESGQPFVIPIAYARRGDELLFHGSTGAGGLRAVAEGRPVCFNVMVLDGLVLARSGYESSMQYRSVSVLGNCRVLADDEKQPALEYITEWLWPGRGATLRPMLAKEVAATQVLALPIAEWSCKVSEAWPTDSEADLDWPVWAGVVPVRRVLGEPLPAPDLKPEFAEVPGYLKGWRA